MATAVRVFLSYSLDSQAHKARVLALAQRLRADGVDAWLDRFTPFPTQGWPRWMDAEITKASFVVVIATETYARRFAGQAPAGEGLGATWEGAIITNQLYQAGAKNEKFVPAVFSVVDAKQIPGPLQGYAHFRLDTNDGYENLYRHLTRQPEIAPALLGARRDLPSSLSTKAPALDAPAVYDHAVARSNLPRLPYGFFGREEELATSTC
jgi:hypothetical protein